MTKDYAEGYVEAIDDCISAVRAVGNAVIQNKDKPDTIHICASALTDLTIKRNLAKTQMKEVE